MPVDVNPRDPQFALFEGDLLKEALANLPGKVVCLLDACHSGSVAEDGPLVQAAARDDLVRDLVNDEYGVVVMCSSLGSEYSLESSATKQGFFTLGIVEGLSRQGGLQRRRGRLHPRAGRLRRRCACSELSGGMQNPTTGRPPGIRTVPAGETVTLAAEKTGSIAHRCEREGRRRTVHQRGVCEGSGKRTSPTTWQ